MREEILINILTRTSRRPNYFKINRDSVTKQTYKNIRHLIHTDSEEDYEYILKSGIILDDIVYSPKLEKLDLKIEFNSSNGMVYLGHRPYNTFLNKMHEKVNEGWIFYIDDDDKIVSNDAVAKLAKFLELCSYNEVVVFNGSFVNMSRTVFKRYVLPKKKVAEKIINGYPPEFGEIGGICFAFHHSKKQVAEWDEFSGSDYRVFLKLMEVCKVKYLPEIITSVYDRPNGGVERDLLM